MCLLQEFSLISHFIVMVLVYELFKAEYQLLKISSYKAQIIH
jgi:hypothetical protein